jgi:hypothetical protein
MEAGIVIAAGIAVAAVLGLAVRMVDEALTSLAWRRQHGLALAWARPEVPVASLLRLVRHALDAVGPTGRDGATSRLGTVEPRMETSVAYETVLLRRERGSLQRELALAPVPFTLFKEAIEERPRPPYPECWNRIELTAAHEFPRARAFSVATAGPMKLAKSALESEPRVTPKQFVVLTRESPKKTLESACAG